MGVRNWMPDSAQERPLWFEGVSSICVAFAVTVVRECRMLVLSAVYLCSEVRSHVHNSMICRHSVPRGAAITLETECYFMEDH